MDYKASDGCPCSRLQCQRHGNCAACLAYNEKKGKTASCIRHGGHPIPPAAARPPRPSPPASTE